MEIPLGITLSFWLGLHLIGREARPNGNRQAMSSNPVVEAEGEDERDVQDELMIVCLV